MTALTPTICAHPVLARTNVFEFVGGLLRGESSFWIALAAIAGCIAFFVIYEKVTGRPFVKSRSARHRRKHVIWEYHRDR